MTTMANAVSNTAVLDTKAAGEAALRQTRGASDGARLPMSASKRLASMAVKAWAKDTSAFVPMSADDRNVLKYAAECQAAGRPVMLLKPDRAKLGRLRYIAKALRLALRVTAEGRSDRVVAAASTFRKLNFSYGDAHRHAKAFMSAKRRADIGSAKKRTLAPRDRFSTAKKYVLSRVSSESDLLDVAKTFGNCLATDRDRRRNAVQAMKENCVAFFLLTSPAGKPIGLMETGKHGKATWQAVEFRGRANAPVSVGRSTMEILMRKAQIAVADCAELHDLGLADELTSIVKSAGFALGGMKMSIEVAAKAIRIDAGAERPFVFKRTRGGWVILGENAFMCPDRAMDLLTATSGFWAEILVDQGSFENAEF